MDGASVLRRLASMPVTTWQYRAERGRVRHMGPMAQDFRRAFGLGTDDRTIGTNDAVGVSLAAVKALNAKAAAQDRRLSRQAREIRELKAQVAALVARHGR